MECSEGSFGTELCLVWRPEIVGDVPRRLRRRKRVERELSNGLGFISLAAADAVRSVLDVHEEGRVVTLDDGSLWRASTPKT